MKTVVTVCAAIMATLVIVSFSFAQMDMKMEHKGTMGSEHMMGDMSSLTNDMSGMMTQMTGMMKDMNTEKMKKMSGLMKDMSQEMMNMSNMMGSGKKTDREMEKMHVRISKLQKMLSDMEMKK